MSAELALGWRLRAQGAPLAAPRVRGAQLAAAATTWGSLPAAVAAANPNRRPLCDKWSVP